MIKRGKRLLSLLLVLVMFVSVATPAFAWGGGIDIGSGWDREIGEGEVHEITDIDPETEPDDDPYEFFKGEDLDAGLTVTVAAPMGALPSLTEVRVAPVEPESVRDAVEQVVEGEPNILLAVDISFWVDDIEIEPEEPVRVKIAADELEDQTNLTVVHIPDEAEPETVELIPEDDLTYELGTNEVAFQSGEFSVYAVIGGEGATKLLTINFFDQNGQPINTQLYRFDQVNDPDGPVFDPGVPTITATQSFEGWTTKQNYTAEDSGTGLSVTDINNYIKETYGEGSEADVTLNYYPMVYDVFYVIYHDQAGAVLKTEYVIKPTSEEAAEVTVNMTYVPFLSGQNFAGWTPDIVDMGDNPTYTAEPRVYANHSKQSFSADIRLYPLVETGYWLTFDNNIGQDADTTTASYTSPVFYKKDASTSAPATPTRTGYEFGGWYVDEEMTTAYDFGAPLTEDTTIYAKWNPLNAEYLVVFMVQNATDAYDDNVSNNTYSYYDAVRRDWAWENGSKQNATTGSMVSAYTSGTVNDSTLASGDLTGSMYATEVPELGQYFEYSSKNTGVTTMVKGDGSAVLYVYYDRKPVTIHFHEGSYTSSSSALHPGGSNYYRASIRYFGVVNGETVPLVLTSTSASYPDSDGDIYYYYAKFTVKSTGASYTPGTLYVYNGATTSSAVSKTITGLYGAPMAEGEWPEYDDAFSWGFVSNGTAIDTYVKVYSSFVLPASYEGDPFEMNYYLVTDKVPTSSKPIYYISQDPETGEWGTEDGSTSADNQYNRIFSDYTGHKLVGYNLRRNSRVSSQGYKSFSGKTLTISLNDITGDAAYVYYELTNANLVFRSKTGIVRQESLRYGQSIGKYQYVLDENGNYTLDEKGEKIEYIPTDGGDGYYFEGWYEDEGYQVPFDFENSYMPDEPVTLYAKWTQMRFRIVLDPTGGDENVDPETITFPGNQVTTFRVNYGEKVQGSSINNAEREGHNLIGWYLDPEFTIPFNFDDPITDQIENMDMDYATASDEERRGTDPWNDESPTYSDVYSVENPKYSNVRGKLTIYARWREDPKGTIGMNVEYDAMDGLFSANNLQTWEDPFIYVDHAEAFAQPASTPNNSNLQFLYWQIMKPTSKDDPTLIPTDKKVYPGQTWEVLLSDAVVTEVASTGDGTNGLVLDPANLQRLRSGNVADTMAAETETRTLLTEGFEGDVSGWSTVNAGSGNDWTLDSTGSYAHNGSKAAQVQYSSSYAANCYLISAPFTVDANALTLDVSLFERVRSSTYAEQFEVFFVKDSDVTNGSIVSATHYTAIASANYTNTSYAEKNGSVSAADLAGQDVRLVIHCTSEANKYYLYIDDITVTETVTVAPSTVTISFDSNGGYGSMDDQIVPIGVPTSLNENKFTHFGYSFAGWSTVPGEAEPVYADKEDVTISEDLTLYAQWTMNNPHKLTVKYVGPEGDTDFVAPEDHVEQVPEGARFRVVSPEVEGYRPNPSRVTGRMGSEDMVVTVTYVKDTNQRYTVYLHAVYGKSNTSNMTHITWYANNGTGDYMESNTVRINETLQIPVPSAMVTSGKPYVAWNAGDGKPDLVWEDHVFLGWARVNESTMEGQEYWNTSSDHPWEIDLGEDDLFLKYDPDNKTFLANNNIESTDIHPEVSLNYVLFGYINGRNYSCEENAAERSEYRFDANGKLSVVFDADSYVAVKETNGKAWFMTNGYPGDSATSAILYNTSDLENKDKLKVPGGVPVTFTLVENSDGSLTLSYTVASASTNSTGIVRADSDEGESGSEWSPVNYVAADEKMPYHAMYAVWGKVLYIYHTGTGVVERVVVADKTLDVADRTSEGYLYGGYYKSYSGQGETFDVKNAEWLTPSDDVIATMSKESQADAAKGWLTITSDDGCTKYSGMTKTTDGNAVPVFDINQAYSSLNGDADGMHVVPKAGETYYIKEVPASKYLQPYFHYTYKKGDTNPIVTAWLISDIDDNLYQQTGFVIVDANNQALVCSSLTVENSVGGAKVYLTPSSIFRAKDVTGGYLSYLEVITNYEQRLLHECNSVLQYWVTPDGLIVTGIAQRSYANLTDKKTVKAGVTDTTVDSTIAVFKAPAGNP